MCIFPGHSSLSADSLHMTAAKHLKFQCRITYWELVEMLLEKCITMHTYCHKAAAWIIMILQVPLWRVWSWVAKRYRGSESKLDFCHQHEHCSRCTDTGGWCTRASDAKRWFLATRTSSEPDDILYIAVHVERKLLGVVLLRRDRSRSAERDASLRLDSEPGGHIPQYLRHVALWWHVYYERNGVSCQLHQHRNDPVGSSSGFPTGSHFECPWALCCHFRATWTQSNIYLRW